MSQKIALVTGANRGIGLAIAKHLLREDIQVIATYRHDDTSGRMIEELNRMGAQTESQAHYCRLDVTDPDSVVGAVGYVGNRFGRLDLLFNNAGINYDTWHRVENADLNEVRTTFETNLFGPWRLIQALLPLLRASDSARIVNVSSGAGTFGSQNGSTPGYSLSKFALNGLTRHFAESLRADGIAVNAVGPGWVRTDMGGMNADRSPEQGADSVVKAAFLDRHDPPTGGFYRDGKRIDW